MEYIFTAHALFRVSKRKLSEEEKYAIIEFLKSYKYGDIEPETVARPTSYPCSDTNKTYGE